MTCSHYEMRTILILNMSTRFRFVNSAKYLRNRKINVRRISVGKSLAAVAVFGGTLWYEIYSLKERFSHILPENVDFSRGFLSPEFIRVPDYSENTDEDLNDKKILLDTFIQTVFSGHKQACDNPFYFLRLLKSGTSSPVERRAALLALAYSSHLNDGTCQELAQSIDLKTAVKLARIPDADLRLFLAPPGVPPSDESIESCFQKLVFRFPDQSDDCATYFSEMAINSHHKTKNQEAKVLKGMTRRSGDPWRVTYLYLQSILHHTESAPNVQVFVQSGGLSLLWRAFQEFQEPLIRSHIVQIIANVALFTEQHVHLFQSGWVGILSQLSRSADVNVSLPACKALANIDEDSRNLGVYDSSVFLLHPTFEQQREVDVVFVHGLLGGVFWTWRQNDVAHFVNDSKYTKCWPRDWLPADVDGLRVLAVDYDTSLSHWKPACPEEYQRSIKGRSDGLLSSLKRAGLGDKPIVWVAHSMGGLVVKQLLLSAEASSDPIGQKIVNQSRALMMLSVPHRGSALANLNPTARLILLPSVEVQELQLGSPKLLELHDNFLDFLKRHQVAILSLIETRSTLIAALRTELRIVDRDSADPGVGEIHYVPATHLDICKPFSRDSFVYKRLVKLLRGVKAGSPPRELATSS